MHISTAYADRYEKPWMLPWGKSMSKVLIAGALFVFGASEWADAVAILLGD